MRRLRVTLMGAALLVAGTAVAVDARPDDLERAGSLASKVEPPRGAVPSDDCHGDHVEGCWTVSTSVLAVAEALARSLSDLAGSAPTQTCDRVPVGTTGAPISADACFVRTRFGEHGVFVFVDPLTERDAAGVAQVVGSRVSLSAS